MKIRPFELVSCCTLYKAPRCEHALVFSRDNKLYLILLYGYVCLRVFVRSVATYV